MSSYALGRMHAADLVRVFNLDVAAKNMRETMDDDRPRARRQKYIAGYVDALLEGATS